MEDFKLKRMNMILSQIEPNAITDEFVINAMGNVEKETYLKSEMHHIAYSDCEIEIKTDKLSSLILSPLNFASMLQAANLHEDDFVLDIGCASGYSCAVLGEIVSSVIGIEQDEKLVELASDNLVEVGNAAVVKSSYNDGLESQGPYDVIFIEGGVNKIDDKIFDQLKNGGRLISIEYESNIGSLVKFVKNDGVIGKRFIRNVNASLIAEFMKEEEFSL